jgi:hypothetical protein
MIWWKALLWDLAIMLATSGLVAVILRSWLERREQMRWPSVVATVTEYKQRLATKGEATFLVGHYTSGNEQRTFSVAWGPSDFTSWWGGAWVPPAGMPPLGATVLLHVDPNRPAVVALDDDPSAVKGPRTFATVALLVLLAAGMGVAFWFM